MDKILQTEKKVWFKKNLLGIVGIIGTILFGILSVIFYSESIKNRELIFVYDIDKTILFNSKIISMAPIKLINKNDNKEISSDLIIVKFYMWNGGKESIKTENILKDVTINIDDNKSEILDFNLLSFTRDECNIQLIKKDKNSLLIICLSPCCINSFTLE